MHPEHSRWSGPVHPGPSLPEAETRTVYVTNFGSSGSPGFFGPTHRRVFTVVNNPAHWSSGDGNVPVFTPSDELWSDWESKTLTAGFMDRFREEVWARSYAGDMLLPGRLKGRLGLRWRRDEWDERVVVPVKHGDTLCCTCSRQAALDGECHRVPTAYALVAHGWHVILDGQPLKDRVVDPVARSD